MWHSQSDYRKAFVNWVLRNSRSAWRRFKRPARLALSTLAVLASFVLLGAVISAGYSSPWTGFGGHIGSNGQVEPSKTLWDWLQLLIIPTVLAAAAFLFNRSERSAERKAQENRADIERQINHNRDRENALQGYFDDMVDLLLDRGLREASEKSDIGYVARLRTVTTLRQLDGRRKGIVLQFLHDSELIGRGKLIVNLQGTLLDGVQLYSGNLGGSDLKRTSLGNADLRWTKLNEVDLGDTDLEYANLSSTHLEGAILCGAKLKNSDLSLTFLTRADLTGARMQSVSLEGAWLSEARIINANLTGANLNIANLVRADLSGANLTHAILTGADITDTDFSGAVLDGASFAGARNMHGLDILAANLLKAESLKRTRMPDGSVHT